MPYANMAKDENNGLPLCRRAVKKFLSGRRSRRRGLKKRPGGAREVGLTSRTAEEQLVGARDYRWALQRDQTRTGFPSRDAPHDRPAGSPAGAHLVSAPANRSPSSRRAA